ncbi:MAG: DUF4332 domain-containing protein [Lachnospiraceae bacterium]|nr:DUF4332 domain-containing protein [Lachnospiraceae bacterium]
MAKKLISIVGIDNKVGQLLRDKAGISTVKQLYDATRTFTDREKLAEKTKFSVANITHWAAQAELLRVDEMDIDLAYDFIDAGIFSVNQFMSADVKEIFEKVKRANVYSTITENTIRRLKKSFVHVAKPFEYDNIQKELVEVKNNVPNVYSDLSSIISELGKGISQAQLSLDQSAIDIQNKILQDDKLYNMGLQATWYVMPEVEFTLKMDYSVAEERTVSGKVVSRKLFAAPSNATFTNLFKSSKKEESTLKLKFVPIPISDRMTVRRYMPDLSKIDSYDKLLTALEDAEITNYTILPNEAATWGDVAIEVISQNPIANTLIQIGITPTIHIKRLSGK